MEFWTLLIFLAVAVPASVYDVIKMRIPLFLVAGGIIAYIIFYAFWFDFKFVYFLRECVWGVTGTVLVLIIARLLTGGGLGWGDVIFGVFSSLFIGYPLFCFISLTISALTGLIFFLLFSLTRRSKNSNGLVIRHSFAFPYIPFMSAGTLITYFLLWINWLHF